MKRVGMIVFATLVMTLGACSVKEEKTLPAGTTTGKTYSLF